MEKIAYIKEQTLTDIGNTIREQLGTSDKMLPSQMPENILKISGGVVA